MSDIDIDIGLDEKTVLGPLKKMTKGLDAMKSMAKKTGKGLSESLGSGFKEVAKQAKKTGAGIQKGFNNAIKKIKPVNVALFGFGAIVAGAAGATLAVKKLIGEQSKLHKQKAKLKQYGEEGKKAFDEITEFANSTGIETDILRESANNLADVWDPESTVEITKVMSDLEAKMGGGQESIVASTQVLAEMGNKAEITRGDLEQFTKEAGNISLDKLVSNISAATGKSTQEIQNMVDSGTIGMEQILAGAREMGQVGGKSGLGAMNDAAGDAGKQIQRFKNIFKSSMEDIVENIPESAIKMIKDLADELQRFANSEKAQAFFKKVGKNIGELIKSGIKKIPDILDSAKSAWDKFTGALEWIDENGKAIKAVLGGLAGTIAVALIPAAWGIVTAAWAAVPAFIAAAVAMAPIIIVALLVGAAIAAIIYYWNDIKEFFSNLPEIITDAFNTAIDFVKSLPEKFLNLANDIIDGLIDGLLKGDQLIKDTMKDLAKGAIDGFKSFLGISSPSKVFAEFGVNTTEGFGEGLDDGSKDIEGKMDGLVNLDGMEGASNVNNDHSRNAQNLTFNINLDGETAGNEESLRQTIRNEMLPGVLEALERLRQQGAGA